MSRQNTVDLSLAAMVGAIYILTNMIPISQFIGSAVFIPLSIVVVPVMAWILRPRYAALASIIGGLGSLVLNPIGTAGMGVFAVLIPFVAVTLGSITIHVNGWTSIIWIIVEFIIYIIRYNGEATYLWGTHYAVAAVIGIYALTTKKKSAIWLVPAITMGENAMLNLFSMYVVNIAAPIWSFIVIPSILERSIAAVGAIILIKGLAKALPQLVPER